MEPENETAGKPLRAARRFRASYPESGDLLPLFFFLPPPRGLIRPR